MWTSFQGCINDNIPDTSEESYIKMSFLVSTIIYLYFFVQNIFLLTLSLDYTKEKDMKSGA